MGYITVSNYPSPNSEKGKEEGAHGKDKGRLDNAVHRLIGKLLASGEEIEKQHKKSHGQSVYDNFIK